MILLCSISEISLEKQENYLLCLRKERVGGLPPRSFHRSSAPTARAVTVTKQDPEQLVTQW